VAQDENDQDEDDEEDHAAVVDWEGRRWGERSRTRRTRATK